MRKETNKNKSTGIKKAYPEVLPQKRRTKNFKYEVGDVIVTSDTKDRFVIRDIKEGGMGVVYIGEKENEEKLYALKTVKEEILVRSKSLLERFNWEAQVWVTLGRHKNIVWAQWVDYMESKPFLILEYVPGEKSCGNTLRGWLQKSSLDIRLSLNLGIQMCTGMLFAKKVFEEEFNKSFVHRDLKPANIMVSLDGVVKVTDFGLVKAFDAFDENIEAEVKDSFGKRPSILKKGSICGTPPYMAPEQWKGEESDERTDIYAFGCVLYEMLTKRPPFVGKDLRNCHLKEIPKPLRSQHVEIPARLNSLVMRCLEKEKEKRVQGISELRDYLQKVHEELTGEKVIVKDVGEELNANGWSRKGVGFKNLGKYQKAIECFDKAIKIDKDDHKVYLNRGLAHHLLSQYEKAITDYEKVIELNPWYAKAYNNRGNAHLRLGKYEKAIEDYEKAMALNPNYAEPYYNLGNAYFDLGDYRKAIKAYREAIMQNPSDVGAHYNLGLSYTRLLKHMEAADCYSRGIKINPADGELFLNRAGAYACLGKDKLATRDLRSFAQLTSYTHSTNLRKDNYPAIGESKDRLMDSLRAYEMGDITKEKFLEVIDECNSIL
jgi:serine/threonine protein kinase